MNTKLWTSVGCLLLLAAGMAPTALGHDDNADDPTDAELDGVSGRYVGSSGPALINSGNPITVNGDPEVVIPSGPLVAGGLMSCDLEVAGPGIIPTPQDEVNVDQYAATADPTDGDGIMANSIGAEGPTPGPDAASVDNDGPFAGWDDGGHGGACHVNSYGFDDYNTAGCPEAFAFANDDLHGGEVFIGASCDWESQGGSSSLDGAVGLPICLANVAIQGGAGLQNCLDALVNLVTCITAPATCPVSPGGDVCGSDGSSDGTSYGWGGDGVPYPSGANVAQFGETYNQPDDDLDNCPTSDASAAVFVFDSGDINDLDGPGSLDADDVKEATRGNLVQKVQKLFIALGIPFDPEPLLCTGVSVNTPLGTTWEAECAGPGAYVCGPAATRHGGKSAFACQTVWDSCVPIRVQAEAKVIDPKTRAWTDIICDPDTGPGANHYDGDEIFAAPADTLTGGSAQGFKSWLGSYICHFEVAGPNTAGGGSIHVCRDK